MTKIEMLVTVQFHPEQYGPTRVITRWQVAGRDAGFLELLRQRLERDNPHWEIIRNSSGQAELHCRQFDVVPSVAEVERQAAMVWDAVLLIEKELQTFRLLHKAAGLGNGE